jgi:hypothetical protein
VAPRSSSAIPWSGCGRGLSFFSPSRCSLRRAAGNRLWFPASQAIKRALSEAGAVPRKAGAPVAVAVEVRRARAARAVRPARTSHPSSIRAVRTLPLPKASSSAMCSGSERTVPSASVVIRTSRTRSATAAINSRSARSARRRVLGRRGRSAMAERSTALPVISASSVPRRVNVACASARSTDRRNVLPASSAARRTHTGSECAREMARAAVRSRPVR